MDQSGESSEAQDRLPEEVSRPSSLDPAVTIIRNYPQPNPDYHPFLREIRPLASSGIFSPPHSQPLVFLPNNLPISPISRVSELTGTQQTPDSVFIPPEEHLYRGNNWLLHRSSVKQWMQALNPEQEWDTFNPSPTFRNSQEFWDSRGLGLTFLQDLTNLESQPKIPIVSDCTEFDFPKIISQLLKLWQVKLMQLSYFAHKLEMGLTRLSI